MKKVLVTRSSMPPYDEFVEMIKPLWDSHWLTNMGEFHNELEKKLQDYLGVKYVSLLVNGHLALEMALQSYGFPKGAEVITTPFTFISTTHAIVRNGLQPIFCDVKPEDGTIDESKIENLISEKTVAIVPVHVYGNPCNVEEIARIAKKHGLKVVYDAAHAFAVKYKSCGIGSYGDASIFSFHATKVFNTVEGGAVTFSEQSMYEKLYNLKNFGIRSAELVVDVGANAKMNELCAVMGLCNLKYIDAAIQARKIVWDYYFSALKCCKGIRVLTPRKNTVQNYAYFPIIVEDDFRISRDELFDEMEQNGIGVRKYFYPLTCDQACFKNMYCNVDLPVARDLAKKVLCLPIYEDLSLDVVKKIVGIINAD